MPLLGRFFVVGFFVLFWFSLVFLLSVLGFFVVFTRC